MKELLNEPLFWMYLTSFLITFIYSFNEYLKEVDDNMAREHLELVLASFVPLINSGLCIGIVYAFFVYGLEGLRKRNIRDKRKYNIYEYKIYKYE